MRQRSHVLLLTAAALLSACANEETRREYLYKPAYCLAGGLANMGSEACLPAPLKEKADAVATAKLNSQTPQTPAEDTRVFYTDDQRLAMGYTIARELFAPDAKLTRTSATMSLEAANLITPPPVDKQCGADKARRDVIRYVEGLMGEHPINRDTAQFLSEHYTDLQLAELYRVATTDGALKDVKADVFIMPDPKRKGATINVAPKGGTAMGGILSYTTSRVASRMVEQHKTHINGILKERAAHYRARAATTDTACADPSAPTTEPAALPAPTTEVKE